MYIKTKMDCDAKIVAKYGFFDWEVEIL